MKENFKKQVEQNGLTIEQYYQITGQKEEDTVKSMRAQAELNLKNFLVISEISKLENIKVEQKELDAEYQKIADQYGMDVAKVKEILGPQSQQLASDIHQRKIIDFLLANNE